MDGMYQKRAFSIHSRPMVKYVGKKNKKWMVSLRKG